MLNLPKRIAHRGASALAPENTLAALAMAADLGASWVEFDVALTADHSVVVMHDVTINRTTDGCGAVRRLTWNQLRHCDAGSWFAPCYRGERIPLLSEWLELAKQRGLRLNIECKVSKLSDAPALVRAVKACLLAQNFPESDCLLSSSQLACVQACYDMVPDVPRALIVDRLTERDMIQAKRLHCVSVNPNQLHLDKALVQQLGQAGLLCLAWTANSPSRVAQLHQLGVTSVFSDVVA